MDRNTSLSFHVKINIYDMYPDIRQNKVIYNKKQQKMPITINFLMNIFMKSAFIQIIMIIIIIKSTYIIEDICNILLTHAQPQ